MDDISNQQNDNSKPLSYSTPFNVDFFLTKSNSGYFNEYIKRFLSLSEPIKSILTNLSTAEFIEETLGQTFGLNANQKTEFTRILRDILLADMFWGDFPKTVSARLQVAPDTAIQIVKAITDGLLTPALEDIKAMQIERFGNRISQSQSNQSQTQTQPPQQNTNSEQGNVINLRNQK